MKSIIIKSLVLVAPLFIMGCNKAVEVDAPATNPSTASVYTTDTKAAAVLTGVLGNISRGRFAQGTTGISIYGGLSADELQTDASVNPDLTEVYMNSKLAQSISMWTDIYQQLYVVNAAIEGLEASTGVTAAAKSRLTGEAKFLRAFLHFYLVNLWGDVPMILTSDYRVNARLSRTPKDEVYVQIVKDLKEAQTLLPDNYVTPAGATTDVRLRPNKAVATALLARAYLYMHQWADAETEASTVLQDARFSLGALSDAFLTSSPEALWQLPSTWNDVNTEDGHTFILQGDPTFVEPVWLRDDLVNSFEDGDQRRQLWIDSAQGGMQYYYAAKYRVKGGFPNVPVSEYLMVMRLAEQYLIRAEARAKQNKVTEGAQDLDAVRTRAGLAGTDAADSSSLLAAIMRERRAELFTEWGHRWLDLKRTGTVDAVMSTVTPLKGGTWNTHYQLYAIPKDDILRDGNLTQNPDY